MTGIRAVLFDADGVVINPMLQFSRLLESEYGITPAMTRTFFGGIFKECLAGQADLSEVLPPFLETWRWTGGVDEFIGLWMAADDHPDRALLAAIQDLRQAGTLCGLATLQERNRAAYMRTSMNFSTSFDRLFFSCDMGCLKPAPVFYQKIQAELGLPGEAILFWDDAPPNVAAAREMGWQAELYTGFAAFQERMRTLFP